MLRFTAFVLAATAVWLEPPTAAAQPRLPRPVHGDFDHDGKPDVALVKSIGHGKFQLVVRRGAAGHPIAVVDEMKAEDLSDLYVTRARPGRWRTWCGKGGDIGDDEPCEPFVRLRGDTLDFGTKESSEAVAIWTGRRFKIVWLSD